MRTTEQHATKITVENTEDDRAIRDLVARHDEIIKDHDEVLVELKNHLREMVSSVNAFQTKALVIAALFLASTEPGQKLLSLIGV